MHASDPCALRTRLAHHPGDVEARASLYRLLHDRGDVPLEALRVAAGLRDPAAMRAAAALAAPAIANRVGPALPQLRGLPVDHLDLPQAELHLLDALAGLPLRSLVLDGPRFACGPEAWRRLPGLALEALEVKAFSRHDDRSSLPSVERLRRLSLRTHGEDFAQAFFRQLAAAPLEELALDRCDDLTDVGLAHGLAASSLRALSFERADGLTARGIAALDRHPLEHLAVGGCKAVSDAPACLAGFPSLRSLRLDDGYAGDGVLRALRSLPLQHLSMRSSHVTEDGLATLQGLPLKSLSLHSPSNLYRLDDTLDALQGLPLERLVIGDMRGFEETGLKHLGGLALRSLDLSLNEVTAKGLQHLAGQPLMSLRLSHCDGIDGRALRTLADLRLPLERLDLSGLHLRDADLACLRDLPLRHLQLLDSPWITDAGVAHLASLPLQHLTIGADAGEARLTSAAVPFLEPLPLETLWLPNCSRIDTEGWSRLAALPARVTGPGI